MWTASDAFWSIMSEAIPLYDTEGPHRCPKGLRHGYAIHALSKGVPLNMLSKWMGHAQMETTAIYANAVGEEQQSIAARMWT
jgi:integrase/recombinase XerD